MSFSEYVDLRRSGKSVDEIATSAPEAKAPEQKQSESEPEGDDELEVDSKDDESNESVDKPKKKSGFERRIGKMTARQKALEQEIEFLKSQAIKSASDVKKEEPVKADAPKNPDSEPNPDDFETLSEYTKAITKWAVKQDRDNAKREEEKAKLLSEQDRVLKAHFDREKAFANEVADYKDVITEFLDDVQNISVTLQELITTSDNGPAIMYELAKDRAEFERLNALSPIAAARELGRFESKLQGKPEPTKEIETKKITKAPKPIEPVGSKGGSVVAKSLDDPNLSFKEFVEMRRSKK